MSIGGAVSGSGGRSGPAEIHVVQFGPGERRRRAWLGLAAWWAAAAMSAFLPVGRLMLVAGFAAFGIYSAVRRYRIEQVVVEVIGNCPECGARQTLAAPEAWEPPAPLTCRACRAALVFSTDPIPEPS